MAAAVVRIVRYEGREKRNFMQTSMVEMNAG
jgi:hypothetical protein